MAILNRSVLIFFPVFIMSVHYGFIVAADQAGKDGGLCYYQQKLSSHEQVRFDQLKQENKALRALTDRKRDKNSKDDECEAKEIVKYYLRGRVSLSEQQKRDIVVTLCSSSGKFNPHTGRWFWEKIEERKKEKKEIKKLLRINEEAHRSAFWDRFLTKKKPQRKRKAYWLS